MWLRIRYMLLPHSGLATQDEVNTTIYTRYGFKLIHQVTAAPGADGQNDLICYIMLREFGKEGVYE